MIEKLQKLQEIIVDFKDLDRTTITKESDLSGDLHLDSADLVELALCIEETFKIEMSPEDQSECETIGELITLIEKLENNKKTEVIK